MKILICSFILVFTSLAFGLELVKIPAGLERELEAVGISFSPDHFSHPSFKVGYLETSSWEKLPHRLRSQIAKLEERIWAVGGYDPVTFQWRPIEPERHYEGYHDYSALTEALKAIAASYPHLVHLETAGKSVQGRELWYVIVSDNVQAEEPEPKFIYHANMHGDEVVGRELMIYFLRYLLDQYGKDSRITQLVNHSQIFIMPSMNPDGFELRTRANARGKDLNRNFPDRFTSTSDTPVGREIEVQHMMNLAARHHFLFGINWHGGELCFNLPWGNISNHNPANKFGDDAFFNPIGREYTEANPPMFRNHHDNFDHGVTYGYEWYPINGGINDWFNHFRRSVHAVIELSKVKWPQASTLANFWEENRDAMLTYLWRGLRGIHLEIRDAEGKLVGAPTIAVASSPKRPIKFENGYVHRLTGDGMQEVLISAVGFHEKTLSLSASYFEGHFTMVTLERK